MEYYGGPGHGGVDGHFYHVFNTVRPQSACSERLLILMVPTLIAIILYVAIKCNCLKPRNLAVILLTVLLRTYRTRTLRTLHSQVVQEAETVRTISDLRSFTHIMPRESSDDSIAIYILHVLRLESAIFKLHQRGDNPRTDRD